MPVSRSALCVTRYAVAAARSDAYVPQSARFGFRYGCPVARYEPAVERYELTVTRQKASVVG